MGQSASQNMAFSMPETNSFGLGPGFEIKDTMYNVRDMLTALQTIAKLFHFRSLLLVRSWASKPLLSHVTTDGDGRSADGVAEVFSLVDP